MSISTARRLPDGREIKIRRVAGGEDRDGLQEVYRELDREDHELRFPTGSRRHLRRAERSLVGRSVTVLARSPEGHPIGEATCYALPVGTAQLEWSVIPEWKGRGVEEAILEAIIEQARQLDVVVVHAIVRDTADDHNRLSRRGWAFQLEGPGFCVYRWSLSPRAGQ